MQAEPQEEKDGRGNSRTFKNTFCFAGREVCPVTYPAPSGVEAWESPYKGAHSQGCFRRHVTAPAAYTHILQAEFPSSIARKHAKTRHPCPITVQHLAVFLRSPAVAAGGGHGACGYHPHKQPFSQKDAHTTMTPCRPWTDCPASGEAAFQPTLPRALEPKL